MARKKTEGEPRTNLLLSLSVEDKKFLKIYAAERGMTVAAVIHEFVEDLRREKWSREDTDNEEE